MQLFYGVTPSLKSYQQKTRVCTKLRRLPKFMLRHENFLQYLHVRCLCIMHTKKSKATTVNLLPIASGGNPFYFQQASYIVKLFLQAIRVSQATLASKPN